MTQEFPDLPPKPLPPEPPDDADCCRSGCEPCVFDLHAQAMERYREELKAWEEKIARLMHDDNVNLP
jgi:hypothetical protein